MKANADAMPKKLLNSLKRTIHADEAAEMDFSLTSPSSKVPWCDEDIRCCGFVIFTVHYVIDAYI